MQFPFVVSRILVDLWNTVAIPAFQATFPLFMRGSFNIAQPLIRPETRDAQRGEKGRGCVRVMVIYLQDSATVYCVALAWPILLPASEVAKNWQPFTVVNLLWYPQRKSQPFQLGDGLTTRGVINGVLTAVTRSWLEEMEYNTCWGPFIREKAIFYSRCIHHLVLEGFTFWRRWISTFDTQPLNHNKKNTVQRCTENQFIYHSRPESTLFSRLFSSQGF